VDELVEKMVDRDPSLLPNVVPERTVGELPPGSAFGDVLDADRTTAVRRLRAAFWLLERLFIMVR